MNTSAGLKSLISWDDPDCHPRCVWGGLYISHHHVLLSMATALSIDFQNCRMCRDAPVDGLDAKLIPADPPCAAAALCLPDGWSQGPLPGP